MRTPDRNRRRFRVFKEESTNMFKVSQQCVLAALIFLFALSTVAPLHAIAPDATLYTNYVVPAGLEGVTWFVCGSLPGSNGCYASGHLGPFGYVGALMEGNPSTNGDTVTRAIYVLDIGAGSEGTGVILYVYKKTDTVTSSSDAVSVTLTKTVDLPAITGGSVALISMAANDKFLFIGTNQSQLAIQVQKSNFELTDVVDQSSGGGVVTAITADKYGYITLNWGDSAGESNAFTVLNPNGEAQEYGGGPEFMLNTTQAVTTSSLHIPN
jgi:hypothetical protein